jgi:hypothetical protein
MPVMIVVPVNIEKPIQTLFFNIDDIASGKAGM